jgi:hypothetical protein
MIELVTIWTKRKKISEERLEICKTCEKYEHRTSRCDKCGCFMKAKTLFMDVECPLGKWGKVKDPS